MKEYSKEIFRKYYVSRKSIKEEIKKQKKELKIKKLLTKNQK